MPTNTAPVGSPLWWLTDLASELDACQPNIAKFEAYYNGHHNLRFATAKFREAFGGLFREFSDNWTEVVVDACVERLAIQGFRFAPQDEGGDSEAWDLWQRNYLDCDSEIAHTEALVCGEASIIVSPQDDGSTTYPLITVEHPSQVVVRRAAGNRRKRNAALKRWLDDSGHLMATVYLPDGIYKFQSKNKIGDSESYSSGSVQWAERVGVAHKTVNPLGVVPVVTLLNKESLMGGGHSDLEQVIPMQDLVNKLLMDMTVASEFQAFRQRVIIGAEVPRNEDGSIIPDVDMKAAASRYWNFEDKDVKVQELSESDLSPYVNAIKLARDHIAARTRTPPHYLLGEIVNASGDALKAAETGLAMKARRKAKFFGESWEEVMRLAFALKGDKARGEAYNAETLWADPENVTEAARVDALVKMKTLGVPTKALWARWDVSPQEIERWEQMLADEAKTMPPPDPEAAGVAATVRGAQHD